MKTLTTLTMLALVMVMSSHTASRTSATAENLNATAIVERLDGIYVFMLCRPATEHDYLGTVKKTLAWSGKPKEMLWAMIRKVRKDYPQANGLVFSTIDMATAEAIKFK